MSTTQEFDDTMADELNPVWERHFEGIADELLHLAVACDLRLRDAGVIDRVLKNDPSVCGRKNEAAFQKLRSLLIAYYDSLGKAIDRIGPEETRQIVDALTARKTRQRDAGGG